jgi:peptide-methionine (R)-S-oxide reductase
MSSFDTAEAEFRSLAYMTRRQLLLGLFAASLWAGFEKNGSAAPPSTIKDIEQMQKNWKSLLAQGFKAPLPSDALKLTKDQWRKRLTAEQFYILREEGTERPGSSPLNDEKRAGVFACAGCDLPLFTSEMKYESGTGWPSFFTTIRGVFGTSTDYKLIYPRTEYHCIRCGGHHGHVFDDGPRPTSKRWSLSPRVGKPRPRPGFSWQTVFRRARAIRAGS